MPARLCSTGEQKALLVGLVLAHAELAAQRRDGIAPILLLDEIAAHLDPSRRAALYDEIVRLGLQAWMTGTDAEPFRPLGSKPSSCALTTPNLFGTGPFGKSLGGPASRNADWRRCDRPVSEVPQRRTSQRRNDLHKQLKNNTENPRKSREKRPFPRAFQPCFV